MSAANGDSGGGGAAARGRGMRPMDGVRVLDVATFLAAPFCGTLLAEFGAEVIKIEQPGVGDPLRRFGTASASDTGDSLIWLQESRNKKSITLDLRKPEGAELLKRLVAESDVLVENFRTGTLERWGVGWETLRAVNPKLVMVRITGFGQTGPKARDPGFARIAHAFSGLSYLAGEPGGPPLMPGSTTLGDYLAGTYGAMGALMALRAAERTGEGQYIDIALYEPVFRYLDEMAVAYAHSGYVRERMGADTVNVVPHSHYPTADGKWVAIACTNDRMFKRLADTMGRPELAAPDRYGPIANRLEHRAEVNEGGGGMVLVASPVRGARPLRRRGGPVRAHPQHRGHLRGRAVRGAGRSRRDRGREGGQGHHARRVPLPFRHAGAGRPPRAAPRRARGRRPRRSPRPRRGGDRAPPERRGDLSPEAARIGSRVRSGRGQEAASSASRSRAGNRRTSSASPSRPASSSHSRSSAVAKRQERRRRSSPSCTRVPPITTWY